MRILFYAWDVVWGMGMEDFVHGSVGMGILWRFPQASGQFHPILKESVISPLLRKSTLDKDQLSNYRSISNLSWLFCAYGMGMGIKIQSPRQLCEFVCYDRTPRTLLDQHAPPQLRRVRTRPSSS